ncbi:MAG TPA: metallophosphoesterase [Bacillales bacterium]|nr:metallophosphoesterase [Bacillales bacterium]
MTLANIRKLLTALMVSLPLSMMALSIQTASADKDVIHLRLMETTDMHGYLMPYNYQKQKKVNRFGYALTASLIRQARGEVKNSMLFDNGDILEGSFLDKYIAYKGLREGEVHPVFKAMNKMDYDAATVGNHEFNFGLKFMNEALDDAHFPYVNANLYYADDDKNPKNDVHYFRPYILLHRTLVDDKGNKHRLTIGVIGFALTQTIHWNRNMERLSGILKAKDIYTTAKKYVPIMKKKGADVIVALSHTGLGKPKLIFKEKNASYDLTKIKGIDAVMFGHVHRVFPGKSFAGISGVNLKNGTVNGVGVVEAGRWGDHLGIIDLTLRKTAKEWKVVSSQSEARPVFDRATGKALVQPDPEIIQAVQGDHTAAVNYLLTPTGQFGRPRKAVNP